MNTYTHLYDHHELFVHYMFSGATQFNADISGWDVSSVTAMNGMFSGATQFNADISGWDVSSVTNMNRMFRGATQFNADISRWDVSRVTDMRDMFTGATQFNANITHWPLYSRTGITIRWKEISMPEDIKDQLERQDRKCPVLLITIVGKALGCLVCKYLFSEEIKAWIDITKTCLHCRSKWQSNVYYAIDASTVPMLKAPGNRAVNGLFPLVQPAHEIRKMNNVSLDREGSESPCT